MALGLPRTARCTSGRSPCSVTFAKWYIKNRDILKNIGFLSLLRGGPCWNCLLYFAAECAFLHFFTADMATHVYVALLRTDGFSPVWAMSCCGLRCWEMWLCHPVVGSGNAGIVGCPVYSAVGSYAVPCSDKMWYCSCEGSDSASRSACDIRHYLQGLKHEAAAPENLTVLPSVGDVLSFASQW